MPGLAGLLFRLGRMSPENYRRHQQGIFKSIRYLNPGEANFRFGIGYPSGVILVKYGP